MRPDINLELVAAGLRPACLIEFTGAPSLARGLKERVTSLGLMLSPVLTLADGSPIGRLVSRSGAMPALPAAGRVSHRWIGLRLGLPCAVVDPWSETNKVVYCTVGVKAVTDRVSVQRLETGDGWMVPCRETITGFWCGSASRATRFCNTLLAQASRQRGGVLDRVLAPRGLELFFVVVSRDGSGMTVGTRATG